MRNSTVVTWGLETISRCIDEYFKHPLANRYINILMRDKAGEIQVVDHIYGPKCVNDTFMVGDRHLEFDTDGAILIDGIRYRPTEGLCKLLFKRTPDEEK